MIINKKIKGKFQTQNGKKSPTELIFKIEQQQTSNYVAILKRH